jgi:hypothetical protein
MGSELANRARQSLLENIFDDMADRWNPHENRNAND